MTKDPRTMHRSLYLLCALLLSVSWYLPANAQERTPETLSKVDVLFELDASTARFNGNPPEGVALIGSRAPLSLDVREGRIELTDPDEDGTWSTVLSFPAGTQRDVSFKWAYLVEGLWVEEYIKGQRNHAFLLTNSASTQSIRMHYDDEPGLIVAAQGNRNDVDNYNTIRASEAGRRNQGDYFYYEAIRHLEEGRREDAAQAYASFKNSESSLFITDDYPLVYAQDLSNQNRTDEAIEFLRGQENEEPSRKRKALFARTVGELYASAGNYDSAITAYERVVSAYSAQEQEVDASRYAIANTLLSQNTPDSRGRAIQLLRGYTTLLDAQHIPSLDTDVIHPLHAELWRQVSLKRLGTAYLSEGKIDLAQRAYLDLAKLGTPEQQLKAKINAWELMLRKDQARQVLSGLEPLLYDIASDQEGIGESILADPELSALRDVAFRGAYHANLLYLKGRALSDLGKETQSISTFEELLSTHPRSKYVRVVRNLLATE